MRTRIINRILLLDGVPNVAGYDKIMVGKTVKGAIGERSGAGRGSHQGAPRQALPHAMMPETT